jgi:hypothetical protein
MWQLSAKPPSLKSRFVGTSRMAIPTSIRYTAFQQGGTTSPVFRSLAKELDDEMVGTCPGFICVVAVC